MNFAKVFWTNKTLEINRKLVSGDVRKRFFALSGEKNGTLCCLGVSPLQYSALFALRQLRMDSMTFQIIDLIVNCTDVPGRGLPFNYNL